MKNMKLLSVVLLTANIQLHGALLSRSAGLGSIARRAFNPQMGQTIVSRFGAPQQTGMVCRRFSSFNPNAFNTALTRGAQPGAQGGYWSRLRGLAVPGAGLVGAGVALRNADEDDQYQEAIMPLIGRSYGSDVDLDIVRAYQVAQKIKKKEQVAQKKEQVAQKIKEKEHESSLLQQLRDATMETELLAIALEKKELANAPKTEISAARTAWSNAYSRKIELEHQVALAKNPNYETENLRVVLAFRKKDLPRRLDQLAIEAAEHRSAGREALAKNVDELWDATMETELLAIALDEKKLANAPKAEISVARTAWSNAYSRKMELEHQVALAKNPNYEAERLREVLEIRKKALPKTMGKLEQEREHVLQSASRLQEEE